MEFVGVVESPANILTHVRNHEVCNGWLAFSNFL